jgi:hypothetical protein
MWTARITDAGRSDALRVMLDCGSGALCYGDVIRAWRGDDEFGSWFNAFLARVSFAAFRWETPPVTTETTSRPFEFVVLDSPSLICQPDPHAFDAHFRGQPESDVVTFANLGGDAILVVPRPVGAADAYGHLAAFVRNAPEPQRAMLWKTVGDAIAWRLSTNPVWLSTAGAGVSWLHVRLDDRPKYYGFAPYRAVP